MLTELKAVLDSGGLQPQPAKLEWTACPLVSEDVVLNFVGEAVLRRSAGEGLLILGCQISLDGSFATEASRRVPEFGLCSGGADPGC